jgi:hypothetical protein
MNKRITLLAMAIYLLFGLTNAQVSITNSTPYTQNFDALPTSSTSTVNPNPANWLRYGGNGITMNVGSGTSSTGGFYSAGTGTNTDRAMGLLLSASAKPLYVGVKFVNNTGAAIVGATLSYKCEQWRRGNTNAGLKDTLLVDYATGTDSVHLGTWINVPSLAGSSTNSTSTTGSLDGNTVFTNVSGSITGMAIPNGATFWIRFSDFDLTPGSDDLLAIDDFSVSFTTGSISACTEPAASVTNVVLNQTGINSVSGSFTGTTPASDGYLVLLDSTATVPTITDATTYTIGQSVGSAIVISNGTSTSFSRGGLVSNTIYKAYVFPYNNTSCTGGPNYKTTAPGNDTTRTLIDVCPEPTGIVTNLVFTNVTNTTITGKFNKAVGAAGYVVMYGTNTILPGVRDSADYTVGQVITQGANTGTVGYFGTDSNFTLTGLTAGTKYYAVVFPYSSCVFGKNYKINFTNDVNKQDTTTLGGAVTCNAPDTIISISVGTVTTNSISGSFVPSTTNPADSFLVIYRKVTFLAQPRDSVHYAVGSSYTQVNGANTDSSYVGAKLSGTATTFTISGLDNNTRYFFAVIPYKACAGFPNYNTKISFASNKASATTGASASCPAPDTIKAITVGTVTTNSISGSFTPPSPNAADSFLVIYRKLTFLALPRDSVRYQVGGFYTQVSGANTDTSYVAQILPGTATTFNITGLDNNTRYYFAIIPFKACSGFPNYNLKLSFASNKASATTGASASCPAPDTIRGITVGTITSTSISASFTPPSPNAADSFLVIYRKTTFLALPRDSVHYQVGGFYTATSGANTDTSYVSQILPGSATSFTINGLASNTTYFFAVIPFKACSGFPNYNLKIAFSSNKATAKTSLTTGVKYNNSDAEYAIFPNPTNIGILSVKFKNNLKEDAVIEVVDILGQRLSSQSIVVGTQQQTINVSEFAKGTYILNVIYKGENNVSTFIVQ